MKLFKLTLVAASVFSLTACKTLDPYTGEEKVSNTVKYGAIGAFVCGAIGSRKSGKRARNAALACGLIGAGIGAYMDAQEADLRERLRGSGVQVAREGDNIRLIMPNGITFAVNQANLQQQFHDTLNSVSLVLAEYDETNLQVAGHTDSSGSDSYNYDLSVKRANTVSGYLRQHGVQGGRLTAIGYGETRPIADNGTSDGRAKNRRVELLITPQPKS
ncbi:OmpA family protein [Pleionea sp. CnH1-48]|uniref:OmpA family protein n=1 Tax=Pleionea sp. CnH1-48 TaxID=2954494 RepID=UPI002096DBFF|nr:OmpA family protein [Pleionea sp. CnH1-48]MCO7225381.1 OmpA family protein [Pleionea sp. CnH1-48]